MNEKAIPDKRRTTKLLLATLGAMTAGNNKSKYDETAIKRRIEQFPELIDRLLNIKTKGNSFVFSPVDINVFLSYASELDTDPQYADKVSAILDKPEELSGFSYHVEKGYALFRAVRDPSDSTIPQEPEVSSKLDEKIDLQSIVMHQNFTAVDHTPAAMNGCYNASPIRRTTNYTQRGMVRAMKNQSKRAEETLGTNPEYRREGRSSPVRSGRSVRASRVMDMNNVSSGDRR